MRRAIECPWSRPFDDPIPTPKGKPLLTLKDAAAYIMALPKKEADTAEWQTICVTIGEILRAFTPNAPPIFRNSGYAQS
jgi:hypothetical protein